MRRMSWKLAVSVAAILVTGLVGARAEELNVGDPAPALSLSKWVKGAKVEKFEPGKVYVVEFWATWCGPCKVSIPHLTELQKKYKNEVTFIGVSILEEDFENVAPFVKQMGDKMDYRVATDEVPEGKSSNEGLMATKWLEASGEQGIPTAFIVDKFGQIAWIGHPMEMEAPLAKIVAGDWDVAKVAAQRKKAKENRKLAETLIAELNRARTPEDAAKLLGKIDNVIDNVPEAASFFTVRKLQILLATNESEAAAFAESVGAKQFANEAQLLNAMAWTLIDPEARPKPGKKAVEAALKLAKAASKLDEDKNPMSLDTLALAYFLSGDKAKALETQEKAMSLADDDLKSELEGRLNQYRDAVKK